MEIKNSKKSLVSAFCLAFILGPSFLVFSEQTQAFEFSNSKTKSKKEMTDIDYANIYIVKNPETGDYFKELDKEYSDRKLNARSDSEITNINNEYNEEKENLVLMFSNLEKKSGEIRDLKNKDYSMTPGSGEPKGMAEARRLAATCGRGETVGYSNYFGNPSFYQKNYPFIGSELADIEAVSVLRNEFLPTVNARITKFISDNQISLTLNALVKNRSGVYSEYHAKAGQSEYVDRIVKSSESTSISRNNQLTDDMIRDLHRSLSSFKHRSLVNRSVGRDEDRYEAKSGSDILAECRYYWSKGNTVKDYDPNGDSGYRSVSNRIIHIQPDFYVAKPVQPIGVPIAKQNVNESMLKNDFNVEGVDGRIQEYEDLLGTEDKNESADDIIRRTYGDDFKDPAEFKTLDERVDVSDSYYRNINSESSNGMTNKQEESSIMQRYRSEFSDQQANKELENKNKDDFGSLRDSRQDAQKLNFNDIYN